MQNKKTLYSKKYEFILKQGCTMTIKIISLHKKIKPKT